MPVYYGCRPDSLPSPARYDGLIVLALAPAPRPQPPTTADPHRRLIDRCIEACNTFDVPGMLAVMHPAIEFENRAKGETTASASGMDAFRRLAEAGARLFSSRHQSITAYERVGDASARATPPCKAMQERKRLSRAVR